jgi:formate hydrogenlyase transcriptional activator
MTSSGEGGAVPRSASIGERAEVLLEINNAIASHLELAPLLKAVSECLRRALAHDFAGLAIYDPQIGQLRVHGLDFEAGKNDFAVGQIVPIEGTPAGLAFTSRRPILRERPDPNEFPAEAMLKAMRIGVKSGCVVPLLSHGEALGTLAVASFVKPHTRKPISTFSTRSAYRFPSPSKTSYASTSSAAPKKT